ncbi:MAG: hypothetical protein KAS23_07655 [Anaerohalosphaera sp.]|nr:hypothetical protein [Anaerohalosphaera sp.]
MQYLAILIVAVILFIAYSGCRPISPRNPLGIGAMCYSVAVDLDREEYVCPVCGEKSLYLLGIDSPDAATETKRFSIAEIESCRMIIDEIEGVQIALDESQFCLKCGGGVEKPQLGIIVKDGQTGKEHRSWGVNVEDIVLIRDYLAGKELEDNNRKRALELLGITLGSKE